MKKLVFAVALGAMTLSSGALAQGAPRDLTRAEAQQFADSMFQRFDLNDDGVITRYEADQARAQLSEGKGKRAAKAGKMIDKLFGTNQSVTQQQFQALALARFDRQDVNRDGTVTSAERQQARASREAAQ